ncbi:syntaxin-binding protein 5 isoform X2 [Ischnura elegans]|uniref:syntaxin-binding protein 5 isoform X2 n=1 Tax=Ischnura elegans TaxID=197161 RepID=UPI001ED88EC1|nr:syntaxin-binding protein 5 isoform X2 [Ischnura elegans]
MKKFTFKGVLDGFRSSVSQQPRVDQEIVETLRSEHFQVAKTFRHGFPFQPTALAYDPVQHLLAIGTKSGSIRIVGRPGVDCHLMHPDTNADPAAESLGLGGGSGSRAVIQMQFVLNEGLLLTATADDVIHLWNFKQKRPEVVHSLKFQRERITAMHLPLQSKWIHVGTERGNVHVVHLDTFTLSGYVINWNKAIEVSRKTHPGPVVHLSDNPVDASKLLIGFECGQIVLWDLRGRVAEMRWQGPEPLRSASWHHEGKQFMSSHGDGSLATWTARVSYARPASHIYPHAKTNKDGKLEPCKPIQKMEWKSSRMGEPYIIFSGGLTYDKAGRTPSITVIHGKTTTVLEMEHNVVDFITLCESPWPSDFQDPHAIVVLLHNDVVVIDLLTPGYPCFQNPYPMDVHEAAVTCCSYLADCPSDLIPAFYSVGARSTQKRTGFSEREWPICGGLWSPASCSYNEIILTGHADGSIKFWDASAGTLQVLYKLKTAKVFEKPRPRSVDSGGGGGGTSGVNGEDDPFAIQLISLCPESRRLCVAGSGGQVILFKFRRQESVSDTWVLEIPITYEVYEEGAVGDFITPEGDFPTPARQAAISTSRPESADGSDSKNKKGGDCGLKVRMGQQKKPSGFQAHLVCLTPWVDGHPPSPITALAINSSYGLMAYGNEVGLAIVDMVQRVCLLSVGTPDLYGAADPYQRVPRSPKQLSSGFGSSFTAMSSATGESAAVADVGKERLERWEELEEQGRCRSPSGDQVSSEMTIHGLAPSRATISTSPSPSSLSPNPSGSKDSLLGSEGEREEVKSVEEATVSSVTSAGAKGDDDSSVDEDVEEAVEEGVEALPENMPRTGRRHSWKGFSLKKRIKDKFSSDRMTQRRQSSVATFYPSVSEDPSPTLPTCLVTPSSNDGASKPNRPADLMLPPDPPPSRPPRTRGSRHGANPPEVAPVKQKEATIRCQLQPPPLQHNPSQQHGSNPLGNLFRRFNKLDSSFSRSRSSSMSSLENISSEAIQCLVFADSYTKKSEPTTSPTLWVGTSLGSVLTIMINIPPPGDPRLTQPVIVSPCGTIFRLKGGILAMSFLDCNGALIPYSYESWKDENKESRIKTPTKPSTANTRTSPSSTPTQGQSGGSSGSSGAASWGGPQGSQGQSQDGNSGDRQFVVLVSEKQARVYALPSHSCVYRQQLAEIPFVVKAEVVSLRDSVCLVSYISNGHLAAYSLPSLRPLIDVEFLPLADLSFQTTKQGIVDPMLSIWGQQMFVNEDTDQIARTFCFSNRGHGLYICSPSEVQQFTVSSEFCASMPEMVAELFMTEEMPEAPKESFFKGLFGGGIRTLDREELFGEASGRASRSVARHIPGPCATSVSGTNPSSSTPPSSSAAASSSIEGRNPSSPSTAPSQMDQLNARAGSVSGEVWRAHQAVVERGEKLGLLEERSQRMMNEADNFSHSAHQVMLKYKDKKWYQL